MSQRYRQMIDSKSQRNYSEDDKHRLENSFRSSSIFAIRRIEMESILIANCMVYKTAKVFQFSAWKKRTCILTKVGVVMLGNHIADTIKDVVSVDLLPPKTMICMQTHSCRVYKDRPPGFDAVEKSFQYPLFIEAMLWAKGESMSWTPRRFCLAFATKELRDDWYMTVKKTINSYHHGEAGNSVMAELYTGNPSPRNKSANPRFSDVRDVRDLQMTRDIHLDSMASGLSESSTPRSSLGPTDLAKLQQERTSVSPRATERKSLSNRKSKSSPGKIPSLRKKNMLESKPSETVEPVSTPDSKASEKSPKSNES